MGTVVCVASWTSSAPLESNRTRVVPVPVPELNLNL